MKSNEKLWTFSYLLPYSKEMYDIVDKIKNVILMFMCYNKGDTLERS